MKLADFEIDTDQIHNKAVLSTAGNGLPTMPLYTVQMAVAYIDKISSGKNMDRILYGKVINPYGDGQDYLVNWEKQIGDPMLRVVVVTPIVQLHYLDQDLALAGSGPDPRALEALGDACKELHSVLNKCECGAEKIGCMSHSAWCPKQT